MLIFVVLRVRRAKLDTRSRHDMNKNAVLHAHQSGVNPSGALIYLFICQSAYKKGYTEITNLQLAAISRLGVTSVSLHISALKKAGLLEVFIDKVGGNYRKLTPLSIHTSQRGDSESKARFIVPELMNRLKLIFHNFTAKIPNSTPVQVETIYFLLLGKIELDSQQEMLNMFADYADKQAQKLLAITAAKRANKNHQPLQKSFKSLAYQFTLTRARDYNLSGVLPANIKLYKDEKALPKQVLSGVEGLKFLGLNGTQIDFIIKCSAKDAAAIFAQFASAHPDKKERFLSYATKENPAFIGAGGGAESVF